MSQNPRKIIDHFWRKWLSSWGLTFLVFLIGCIFFFCLFSAYPIINDGDSYFHLAVARAYGLEGFFNDLQWARFSVMHNGFGDKEFLFHVILIPFVHWLPPEWGAKLALAILNALIAAVLTHLSLHAIGNWGLFVPIWVFGTSAAFTLRMTRLRPEILALLILIGATWAASQKRYCWLLVMACLYALSYTAFQALIGLSIGWFVYSGWITRRWEWRIPVYTIVGVAAGLLIHPHFPSNLRIWELQNITFFQIKNILDVGSEIQSAPTSTILSLNLGWLLGLFLFWRSTDKTQAIQDKTLPEAFFLVNAVAFSLLYLLMQRFSIYCIPFVTLSLLFHIRSRSLKISRWTYLPWRGKIPFVAAFGLCLSTSMFGAWHVYANLGSHSAFVAEHLDDWQAFNKILPQDARVAAPWNAAETYVWAAPQARYLNVLDPLFMAIPHPKEYLVQRSIWLGEEPDVPLAVNRHLQSNYIAFPNGPYRSLFRRLSTDPRMRLLYTGRDVLFQIKPQANENFILDWKVMPPGGQWPPDEKDILANGKNYPVFSDPSVHGIEGYINGFRTHPSGKCVDFVHIEEVPEPILIEYELSPYGASGFWHNDISIFETIPPSRAILGQGLRFQLRLEKGLHRFSVRSCFHKGRVGFYLLERSRSPLVAASNESGISDRGNTEVAN